MPILRWNPALFAVTLPLVLAASLAACGGPGSSGPSDPNDPNAPSDPNVDPTGPDAVDPNAPTWYQDVAPLLADRCGGCHVDGGSAPFSVATYDQAAPWGEAMVDSIDRGAMPPFYASSDEVCNIRLPIEEDIHLEPEDKQLVADWVAGGKPLGDAATATPAPMRASSDLATYDVELSLQEPFEIAGDDDIYECFRIPLPNTSTKYLTAMQILPDNDLVVHHVLVWSDPRDASQGQAGDDGAYGCTGFPDILPTDYLGGWAPGGQPIQNPPGTGTPIEGGSLVLNIHYHPTGTTTEHDQTRLRLQWTDEEPENYAKWFMIDEPFGAIVQPGPNDDGRAQFEIPAGVPDHVETQIMTFSPLLYRSDATVFAVAPHMHYLGTDLIATIVHEDGEEDCMIHSPGFRFDFQRGYAYDASAGPLPVIRRGDSVRVQCKYDNSEGNPFMVDHLQASGASAPHDVYWGEETSDEMCLATVGLIVPKTGWNVIGL